MGVNKKKIFESQVKKSRISESVAFPKVVLIDTVSFCNLRCSMCVHKFMKRKKGVMAWRLFTKIIDEIADADKDTRVWLVFFGEALIIKKRKPGIFEMIAYAKKKGLRDVVLNSNATLLDERAAKGLISSGLDGLYIGLDAFTPASYAKIRVGGDYKRTVKNVRRLLELKKSSGAKKPEIFVQFVEMEANKGEKKDFIDFWKKLPVTVKIRPKVSWGGLISAPDQVLRAKDRWPCYWAMRTMSITDTGKVVLCAVDLDARVVVGDITNQSIRDVWTGPLKRIRELHSKKMFASLPGMCRECGDWQAARADYYTTDK